MGAHKTNGTKTKKTFIKKIGGIGQHLPMGGLPRRKEVTKEEGTTQTRREEAKRTAPTAQATTWAEEVGKVWGTADGSGGSGRPGPRICWGEGKRQGTGAYEPKSQITADSEGGEVKHV